MPTADTVFYVSVRGANPNGEYFLIENRQRVQADSAMLRIHCTKSGGPAGCGGGLVIYHVDSTEACLTSDGLCDGAVNDGVIHGVAVVEADGLQDLWTRANRGDAGDPYPGTSSNFGLSFRTDPAALKNSDGSFVGFAVDSIRQLVPDGEMAFRLRFGDLTRVAANDTTALVRVDDVEYAVFRDLLEDGSAHTIAVPDTQLSAGGRTRLTFQAWSDGGAASHQITGQFGGAAYTAELAKAHRLDVNVGGSGSVGTDPPGSGGTYVDDGTPVTLTATPDPSVVFAGWTGDTSAAAATLVLPMHRPYALQANFAPPLVIASSDPRPGATMARAYFDSLEATGGGFTKRWTIVAGTVPFGLALQSDGRIIGTPTQLGTFTFTARVSYLSLTQQRQFTIIVSAPALAVSEVLAQLLTGASALTPEDLLYLDLIGNKTCKSGVGSANCFDVGDFLAWVKTTGVQPPAAPVARPGAGARP